MRYGLFYVREFTPSGDGKPPEPKKQFVRLGNMSHFRNGEGFQLSLYALPVPWKDGEISLVALPEQERKRGPK